MKNNVIKLSDKREPMISEDVLLINNLGQVLELVIKEHGMKRTLEAVNDMIRAIAKKPMKKAG